MERQSLTDQASGKLYARSLSMPEGPAISTVLYVANCRADFVSNFSFPDGTVQPFVRTGKDSGRRDPARSFSSDHRLAAANLSGDSGRQAPDVL